MNFFKQYPSNTYAGSCNNYMLFSENEREITSRMFFRVIDHGEFPYRFFFRNIVDSTFSNGEKSQANRVGDPLMIKETKVGTCSASGNDIAMVEDIPMKSVTYDGNESITLDGGASAWTDEIVLDVEEGEYLVFQWTVSGKNIPYTPDKKFSCYVLSHGFWVPSNECPQPCLVGCDRPVNLRVAFWGDSITQGCQTRDDLYEFWVAEIGKQLPGVAVWNLGLGFGRAQDAATLGAWFEKAKEYDFVSLCFGVNDTREIPDTQKICGYLRTAVTALKEHGVRVGIFTLPPCSYAPAREKIWRECCDYVKNELSKDCEYCFDTVRVLGLNPPFDHMARWNAHPNAVGCKLLADTFIKEHGPIFHE